MEQAFGGIPLERILTYPFRDRKSVERSLLVAALMLASCIVPFLPGLFSSGYTVRILRRAVREGKVEMPDWSDAGDLLMDGLRSTVISLAYLLPGLLTILVSLVVYVASLLLIIPAVDRMDHDATWLVVIPIAVFTVGLVAGILLVMIGALPLPIALCRFADEGRLGAAFELGELFRAVKRNPLGFVVAWGISYGLSSLLYFVYMFLYFSIIFCCLAYPVMFAGAAVVGLIFMAMVGMAYRQGKTAAKTVSGVHT